MKSVSFLLALLIGMTDHLVHAGTLRYCVPIRGDRSLTRAACAKLNDNRRALGVECIATGDRLTCFNYLTSGKADFMVAEPEDLRMLRTRNQSDLSVTHVLKRFAKTSNQHSVQMIAVVKSGFKANWTTKGKRLCYSGIGTPDDAREYDFHYRTYFESWLFPRNCDRYKTELENRIESLSEHFGAACIAGSWSLDRTMDARLKKKYGNLCALCGSPELCTRNDRFYGTRGAVDCLFQRSGEVAWLSRAEVTSHFADLNSRGFTFLCPDGRFASLNSTVANTTCSWIEDLRPVIIARSNVANDVSIKLKNPKIYPIVHSSYKFSDLQPLNETQHALDYLAKFSGYFSASVKARSTCTYDRTIHWCVSSALEAKKCNLMRTVSNAMNLNLRFDCVSMKNRTDSLRAVRRGVCHIFVATFREASAAKKTGLKSIVELMPHSAARDEANVVAAIVRKKSSFKKFADLKGARACFTGLRSVGWNAFYYRMTNKTIGKRSDCSDVGFVANYFKRSCVQGVDKSKFPVHLTSLCKRTKANLSNDEKTFRCLAEDGGDVAFVNYTAAKGYAARNRTIFTNQYRLLCPEENSTDRSCPLAKVSIGSILASDRILPVKEDEIYLMFVTLNRYFGTNFARETPMFDMYGKFEGVQDVIFPRATAAFERVNPAVWYDQPKNQSEISRDVQDCHLRNAATSYDRKIQGAIILLCLYFVSVV